MGYCGAHTRRLILPANKIIKRMKYISLLTIAFIAFTACKRKGCTDPNALNYDDKAKKDNGTCVFDTTSTPATYTVPTTYTFVDATGNSTVNYSGQQDRLNQAREIIEKIENGKNGIISYQDLYDMYVNANGNGNGNFSFSSSKQLRDKTFLADQGTVEFWLNAAATASLSFGQTASNGQAGVLTTGTSSYLINDKGYDVAEIVEKLLMGAVFMDQALNVYMGSSKMNVDNTTAVDPSNGAYYTAMEHHWDEAFGYFGVDVNFPTVMATDFWGKYCNAQNATLNSNADMMNNFLKGRAAISAKVIGDRNAAIAAIRQEWEAISAYQAKTYLNIAIANFGVDNAKFFHVLSEAYGFCYNLRFASEATRKFTPAEHAALMALFEDNLWDMTVSDITAIRAALEAKY